MILIKQSQPTEEDRGQQTVSAPIPEAEAGFNWRNCWYPVTFLQDLPKDRPYSFSLYDEPFVLFTNKEGKLSCVTDRCPHRAARLSDGQIIDGKLECLYHGWQFGVDGRCLHIPQLPAEAKIPVNACLQSWVVVERQGMIWVWPGESEAADREGIPIIAELDQPEFVSMDMVCSLPYDHTYLIENVIDPAHVPISHNGTLGNRKDAQPLEIEIIESSVQGIRGRYRRTQKSNLPWAQIDFVPPNLLHYKFSNEQQGRYWGSAVYSLPLGKNQCRILIRNYQNFVNWQVKIKPRWLDHLYRNKILEQDLQQAVGQKAQIERLGLSLKKLYLPLKTSDLFVIEYRKWLDRCGSSLPFYQGYSTSKLVDDKDECNREPAPLDRLSRHTLICSSCHRAYQVTNKLKQGFVGIAIAMAAFGIITEGFASQIAAASAFVSAAALAAFAEKVKTKFEHSHTHH